MMIYNITECMCGIWQINVLSIYLSIGTYKKATAAVDLCKIVPCAKGPLGHVHTGGLSPSSLSLFLLPSPLINPCEHGTEPGSAL